MEKRINVWLTSIRTPFDTVAVSLPSSLASHLPVLPFSASTTFRRFILFVIQENLFALCAKLRIINETYEF